MGSFQPAKRKGAKLLIALWGDSGTGKTRSGLPIARGLAADPGDDFKDPEVLYRIDQRIFVIDTDTGRALHYAPPEGEPPRADRFAFQHADLRKPFTGDRLIALCSEAASAGAAVILIDSISMLWDGEGGAQDQKERLVDEAVARAKKRHDQRQHNKYPFDEDYERNAASIGAWKGPKRDWRTMERQLLELDTHLIVCGHADDKLRLEKEKDEDGVDTKKTRVVPPGEKPVHERWEPIAEKKFKRRLTVSLILTPEQPGVPFIHKPMDAELAACIPLDRTLNANVGLRLAAWARGAASSQAKTQPFTLPQESVTTSPQEDQVTPSGGGLSLPPPPPPPPPQGGEDDGFPGDFVSFAGKRYDPAKPCPLEAPIDISDMDAHELRDWATALAELMKRAPAHARRAWYDKNTPEIVKIKARGPATATRLEELAGPSDLPPLQEEQQKTGTGDF